MEITMKIQECAPQGFEMTEQKKVALRELAETSLALKLDGYITHPDINRFNIAATEETVIGLIDENATLIVRIEQLGKALNKIATYKRIEDAIHVASAIQRIARASLQSQERHMEKLD